MSSLNYLSSKEEIEKAFKEKNDTGFSKNLLNYIQMKMKQN
jgi:hypothetical protein